MVSIISTLIRLMSNATEIIHIENKTNIDNEKISFLEEGKYYDELDKYVNENSIIKGKYNKLTYFSSLMQCPNYFKYRVKLNTIIENDDEDYLIMEEIKYYKQRRQLLENKSK